jgi:hypothetical protein
MKTLLMRMKLPESGVSGVRPGNLPNQSMNSFRRLSTFFNPFIKLSVIQPDFIIILRIVGTNNLQESSIPGGSGISNNYPVDRLFPSAMSRQSNTYRQSFLLKLKS